MNDGKRRIDAASADPSGPPADLRAAAAALIRFSLAYDEAGNLEIYSCATRTKVLLPAQDVDALIATLQSFDRTASAPEIVCPCPSS